MTRRKDRYQPRAASASQPKTLKTYACARDCTPRRRAHATVIGTLSEAPVQLGDAPRSDYQTLSEILAHGLLRLVSFGAIMRSIRSTLLPRWVTEDGLCSREAWSRPHCTARRHLRRPASVERARHQRPARLVSTPRPHPRAAGRQQLLVPRMVADGAEAPAVQIRDLQEWESCSMGEL